MKKLISLFLTFIMFFVFAGCGDSNFVENFWDFGINYSSESNSAGTCSEDLTASYFSDNSSYSFSSYYSYNESYDEQSDYFSQTPAFYTLESLRDYLNSQKDKDIFKCSFYYKGSEKPEPQMLAQMVSCFYLTYRQGGADDDLYNIEISEYPGDHIVDAYFNNNKSSLTADEQKTLDQALQMVSLLKSKAKDDWELELFIHDMLADHITYYDTNRDVTDPDNPPRFLTSIGALLDGKANCQGYADAFYLLASLSGFKVGRMNVEAKNDLHVVNTILLDGSWYVVDVTFDDQANGAPTSYRLFNAGLDQINDLQWESFKEIHKIAPVSNNYSYYIRNGLVFYNAYDFAEYVKEKWNEGEDTVRGVLKNQTNGDVIKTPLEESLNKEGRSYSYKYWQIQDGKDIYYTVKFE